MPTRRRRQQGSAPIDERITRGKTVAEDAARERLQPGQPTGRAVVLVPVLSLNASLSPEQRRIKEKIIEALQQVYDPELPVNLYDLGLIYRLDLRDAASDDEATGGGGGRVEGRGAEPVSARAVGQIVEIDMTLTAPNCPVAEQIPRQVQEAVAAVEGVERVNVRLVWEPKWDKSRMSEAALLELGLL